MDPIEKKFQFRKIMRCFLITVIQTKVDRITDKTMKTISIILGTAICQKRHNTFARKKTIYIVAIRNPVNDASLLPWSRSVCLLLFVLRVTSMISPFFSSKIASMSAVL